MLNMQTNLTPKELYEFIDDYYKNNSSQKLSDFTSKLVNSEDIVLGVKTPIIKELTKVILKNYNSDTVLKLCQIIGKSNYLEYSILKGLLLMGIKLDLKEKIRYLDEFSYDINNWAVCDIVACSCKHKGNEIKEWVFKMVYPQTEFTFRTRFGIILMMRYYIRDDELTEVFNHLDKLKYGSYYLDMGVAWLLSVALVKQYDSTIKYLLGEHKLSNFVYQKGLQKGIESLRITPIQKEYLRKLKKEGYKNEKF